MHESSMARMRAFVDSRLGRFLGQPLAILDVGGANVNGSYRDVFDDPLRAYQALDVAPGEGIDVVPRRPWRWQDVAAGSYDVIVSGQAFEHIAFPWVTILEMRRALKPGGLHVRCGPLNRP